MQFLLGALLAAVFFICLFMAYTLGQMNREKTQTDDPCPKCGWSKTYEKDTSDEFELEEQREKAKRLKKGFDEMMSYNEAKARKG